MGGGAPAGSAGSGYGCEVKKNQDSRLLAIKTVQKKKAGGLASGFSSHQITFSPIDLACVNSSR